MQADAGELDAVDARAATAELRSLFELFEDDDVLELFEMKEPADAALAFRSPISRQLGIADQRIEAWFTPFGGFPTTGHLSEAGDRPRGMSDLPGRLLTAVVPADVTADQRDDPTSFRVCIRVWEDSFPDREPFDRMPDSWVHHVTATTAEQARRRALEMFPDGATSSGIVDKADNASLDRQNVARISVDVQRVALPQYFKAQSQFHIVATVALAEERLPLLAGHLSAAFPAAVVAYDSTGSFIGVTVNAESYEEAGADLDDFVQSFAASYEADVDLIREASCGTGGRDVEGLMAEIERYAPSGDPRPDLGD
jgi:hypothetical protein